MSAFKIHKTKDFTVLSVHHLKNSQLSLKAKGLLSLMLSLPDDWDYSVIGLSTLSKDGKDAVMSALTELSDAGYIYIESFRNEKGQYESIYNVYEEPNRENRCGKSESDNPTQYSIKINNVNNNPPLSKDNTPKGVESETVEVETILEEEQMFDKFRKAYKGTKRGLQTEFTNFKKKHKDWREVLVILLPSYQAQQTKREQALRQGCFVPQEKNLSTYINQRCWEAEEHFEPDSRSQQRAQQVVPGFVTPEGQARQKRVDEFVEALANS